MLFLLNFAVLKYLTPEQRSLKVQLWCSYILSLLRAVRVEARPSPEGDLALLKMSLCSAWAKPSAVGWHGELHHPTRLRLQRSWLGADRICTAKTTVPMVSSRRTMWWGSNTYPSSLPPKRCHKPCFPPCLWFWCDSYLTLSQALDSVFSCAPKGPPGAVNTGPKTVP